MIQVVGRRRMSCRYGAHHLDLMRWLAQSEVKCIDAQIDEEAGTGIPEKTIVNITYQNGIMAQGHWAFLPLRRKACYDKFELYGEKGTVCDLGTNNVFEISDCQKG